jgi:hypothetical protein
MATQDNARRNTGDSFDPDLDRLFDEMENATDETGAEGGEATNTSDDIASDVETDTDEAKKKEKRWETDDEENMAYEE